jgi:hypothetical protein
MRLAILAHLEICAGLLPDCNVDNRIVGGKHARHGRLQGEINDDN